MRTLGRGEVKQFRCAACAYGASAASPPLRCPTCGGRRWQSEEARPFTRLVRDLLPHRVEAVESAPVAPEMERAVEGTTSARFALREVNEQIRRLSAGWGVEELNLVCECERPGCFATLRISSSEYERVRADPERFLVLAGHEPSPGAVVEVSPGYVVVQCQQELPVTLAATQSGPAGVSRSPVTTSSRPS